MAKLWLTFVKICSCATPLPVHPHNIPAKQVLLLPLFVGKKVKLQGVK
jgi:hypothetical protein